QNPDSWRSGFVPQPLVHPGVTLTDDAGIGRWIAVETENLVASARQAAAFPKEGPVLAAALAAMLFGPFNTRGRWYELRKLVEIGLAATRDEDLSDLQALMHNDLGRIHALLGRADEAVPHVEMALAHWRGTGDRRGEAMTMRVLARALSELGRDDEALEYAHVALATFRDLR